MWSNLISQKTLATSVSRLWKLRKYFRTSKFRFSRNSNVWQMTEMSEKCFFFLIFHLVKPEDEFPSSVLIYLRYWAFSVFNVKCAVSSFAILFQIQRTYGFLSVAFNKVCWKTQPASWWKRERNLILQNLIFHTLYCQLNVGNSIF